MPDLPIVDPRSYGDTGSILGNLFHDIIHIPEQTLQQSRAQRMQGREQMMQEKINQANAEAQIGRMRKADVQAKWGATYGGVPMPENLDVALKMATDRARDQNIDLTKLQTRAGLDAHQQFQDDQIDKLRTPPIPTLADMAGAGDGQSLGKRLLDMAGVKMPAFRLGQPIGNAASSPFPGAGSALPISARLNVEKLTGGSPDQAAQPTPIVPASPTGNPTADRDAFVRARKLQAAEDEKRMTAGVETAKAQAISHQKELDGFRSEFGRDPNGAELNPDGSLSAAGLGAIKSASNNRIKGFMPDDKGGLMPIPGGPADIKAKADQEKLDSAKNATAAKQQMLDDTHAALLDNIAAALPQVGLTTAGNVAGGTFARHIPVLGQGAEDLHSNLDAIKAGLGVDTLNAMRASSTSGNTGIGRIMQVEFEAFAKAARNLDQTQSPAQLKKNLTDLQTHLQNWKQAKAKLDKPAPASPPSGWSVAQ